MAIGARGTCLVNLWEDDRCESSLSLGNGDEGRSLTFSPDGNRLFVGLKSGGLASWRLAEQRPGKTALVSSSAVDDISISPDGRSLLLACEDGLLRLWDVQCSVRSTYDWEIGTVPCVAFAPDGLTAAAGGDGVVMVWDVDG